MATSPVSTGSAESPTRSESAPNSSSFVIEQKGSTVSDSDQAAKNVITVSFDVDANAYEAITQLKELDSQQQIGLAAAAVVVRHDDGTIEEKDEVSNTTWSGTAGGG